MARPKKGTATTTANSTATAPGETTAGYFRKVFEENPEWLEGRSNQAILDRWLQDHPGAKAVPDKIKQNLSNVKSLMRKKLRKKPGRKKRESQPAEATAAPAAPPRKTVRNLDSLELAIDESLTLARHIDREGLADVIGLLRKARNAVVWKMGE